MLTEYFAMNASDPKARELYYWQFPEYYVWHLSHKYWAERKRGYSIGRIVSVRPTKGERYFLRLLLNALRGATSFDALRYVNGEYHPTFCGAALALGLLEADKSVHLCLAEAATYQTPSALRRLFAVMLVYCNPTNARSLWHDFGDHLLEDFIAAPNTSHVLATSKALADIATHLNSMGKNIKDYDLPLSATDIGPPDTRREIEEELRIVTPLADMESVKLLNGSQRAAFDAITHHAPSREPASFFIDGPGGTGKTFLYRAVLASLRSRGCIALATASSGVAASILPGGRMAHSRFKIPLNTDETMNCNVPKQGGLANLLREARLIVWDEAPMVRRQAIEALDRLLQDVCSSDLLFGGKVIVFGGDFRQVLPVLPKGTVQETIESSLLKSYIWPALKKHTLSVNMRAQHDPQFSDFLLRIGDDVEPKVYRDEMALPHTMVIQQKSNDALLQLMKEAFPSLSNAEYSFMQFESRAILAPKNDIVDEINSLLIDRFAGEEVLYRSFDTAVESDHHHFQQDFCNTLTPSGFPKHKLKLKVGCPVMLLRNLDPSRDMCNGTRLICRGFGKNVILAEVASGDYKGSQILLPRIPMLPLESENVPFPFKRTQFPITLCFAMTINKAQGQTLDFVGICLSEPVFAHGQLYVALSRARTSAFVRVLVDSELLYDQTEATARNVMYSEVLAFL